jgi:alkylated DNA repair dioxygenase AlkB
MTLNTGTIVTSKYFAKNNTKNSTVTDRKRTLDSSELGDQEIPKKKIKQEEIKWIINDEQAKVSYHPTFLSKNEADNFFRAIRDEAAWKQEKIKIMGKEVYPSRLTTSYSDKNLTYTYSGISKTSTEWIKPLWQLRDKITEKTGVRYNYALLNLYRNGKDYIGPHSDSEKDLILDAGIASVSLGSERDFVLHHRKGEKDNIVLSLRHGSLLVMAGDCQKHYKHSVPARKKDKKERINITFRLVKQ